MPVSPAAVYHFLTGTIKEKGVQAVFQNKQLSGGGQKNNVANCVGPIVWWGLGDRAEALKACQDDKL